MPTTDSAGTPALTQEEQRAFRQAVPAAMLATPYLSGSVSCSRTTRPTMSPCGCWSSTPPPADKSDLVCHARTLRRGRELTFTVITVAMPVVGWWPTGPRPTDRLRGRREGQRVAETTDGTRRSPAPASFCRR